MKSPKNVALYTEALWFARNEIMDDKMVEQAQVIDKVPDWRALLQKTQRELAKAHSPQRRKRILLEFAVSCLNAGWYLGTDDAIEADEVRMAG